MASVEEEIEAYFEDNNIRESANRYTSLKNILSKDICASVTLGKHIKSMMDKEYLTSRPYKNRGGTGTAFAIKDSTSQSGDVDRVLDVSELV